MSVPKIEYGSFKTAAKAFTPKRPPINTVILAIISQPAITYRLQKLEEEFGVKIVYRGHRGVTFTPQGEYLADYAAKMQRDY
ncbi:LysR family transcriptional regulator [Cytobacillus firmus]|uniref:LysR family transcriptional regulator n=1 Tax=Cytobacillus firmus TaxID=1399 RepID=UPI0034A31A48